jgi:uncharacterized phiE125 gp8 family phage protein
MSLVLVSAPAAAPLSLAEAKAALRLDDIDDDQDALVAGYVRAATDLVEVQTGLCLLTQSWVWQTDGFPGVYGWLRLLLAPLQSIEQIEYVTAAGTTIELSPDTYVVHGVGSTQPARLVLAPNGQWPSTWRGCGTVTIRMTLGWPDWNGIPESLRQAVMVATASMYDGCDAGPAIGELIGPYKVWAV